MHEDQISGQPKTTKTGDNNRKLQKLFRSDRCLTSRMMAEMLGMNNVSILKIIIEGLSMRKVCAKLVSKEKRVHRRK